VLTGPPGSGKSTVSRLVAERFDPAACVESDWFWTTLVRGHVLPWLPEADAQNRTVLRAFAAAAGELAGGGYTVVVDGIIGPWYLDLVTDLLARTGAEVHYVVLRPPLDVAVARVTARVGEERVPGHPALVEEGPVRFMWEQFADLGRHEIHVVDNGDLDAEQTATLVWSRFVNGTDRL
jgi:predicted kinase